MDCTFLCRILLRNSTLAPAVRPLEPGQWVLLCARGRQEQSSNKRSSGLACRFWFHGDSQQLGRKPSAAVFRHIASLVAGEDESPCNPTSAWRLEPGAIRPDFSNSDNTSSEPTAPTGIAIRPPLSRTQNRNELAHRAISVDGESRIARLSSFRWHARVRRRRATAALSWNLDL